MACTPGGNSLSASSLNFDERIAQARAARTAVAHALACPHQDTLNCPNFASVIAARLAGSPLEEAHPH